MTTAADSTPDSSPNLLENLKQKGNEAFAKGSFEDAIQVFTSSLDYDATQHIIWSNRSAAHASMKNYEMALKDADEAVRLVPNWPKGHTRRGAALMGMTLFEEARKAFEHALTLEPGNENTKKSLEQCLVAARSNKSAPSGPGMNNPFADPAAIGRLASNPKTSSYLRDPSFVAVLNELRVQGMDSLIKHLSDQRVMQCLGVLMNIDVEATRRGSPNAPHQHGDTAEEHACDGHHSHDGPCSEQPPAQPAKTNAPPQLSESQQAKEEGNAAYKSKNFEQAIECYKKAQSLDPLNMSYVMNEAAVHFEQGSWEKCVESCLAAVEVGRENRATFEQIGKAFLRAGNAFMRKGDLEGAIKYFGKSLAEHRTPEALSRLKEAERERDSKAKAAYHSPELAEKEREAGNALFKDGKFAEAVARYTEAIKRNDTDVRTFSNRSACYTKLAAIPEAIKDAEACIKLDPSFVKAYIRKANAELMKHDVQGAIKTLQEASDRDTNGAHAQEIQQLRMRCYTSSAGASEGQGEEKLSHEERVQRAVDRDPELQQILSDPAMRMILQQMQSDPKACMEHMKNPMVATKIQKLISAGVIQTR